MNTPHAHPSGEPGRASLGILFLTVFIDLLGFGLVIPFLPGQARELGASPFVATLTGTAYSAMQFLFVPIWGRLSDRVGRRPVLLASIAATAVSMVALGLADTLTALFATRLFSGVATANIAVAQAYIADRTPPERRARGMGMIGAAFGLGFILGPFIGGELAHLELLGRPGRMPAFAAGGLAVVNLALAAVLLPESLTRESRRLPADGRRPFGWSALRLLRNAAVRRAVVGGTGDSRARSSAGHPGAMPSPAPSLVLGLAPDVFAALLVNFLLVFWFAGLEHTFRLFTEDAFGWSVRQTGRLFGLIGIVLAATQGGLVGRLTPKVGEARLLGSGLVVKLLGFVLLGVSPSLPGAVFFLCVASALVALGMGLISPSLSSYVSKRSSAGSQGQALGDLQSTGALARVFGPMAGGVLYQAIAPTAPYFAGAVGMLLAALLWRRSARQDHAVSP